jgi:hypothetical protein
LDSSLHRGPWLAAEAEIEDEARVADRIAAEPGRGSAAAPKIALNASQQVHPKNSFRISFVPDMFKIKRDFLFV